jgi:hypothetical protein
VQNDAPSRGERSVGGSAKLAAPVQFCESCGSTEPTRRTQRTRAGCSAKPAAPVHHCEFCGSYAAPPHEADAEACGQFCRSCGSCSSLRNLWLMFVVYGAVPFQAYKVAVAAWFFESQCAVVFRHRESDRNRGKRVHRVRRLVKMLVQVRACLANNCALRC